MDVKWNYSINRYYLVYIFIKPITSITGMRGLISYRRFTSRFIKKYLKSNERK